MMRQRIDTSQNLNNILS